MLTPEELSKRFAYHKPKTDDVSQKHDFVRNTLGATTEALLAVLPEGREKSVFITKMEEAMFWANAAIARNQ